MGKQELDAFFAGIVEARGTAYVKHSSGRRRAHLELMFPRPGPGGVFSGALRGRIQDHPRDAPLPPRRDKPRLSGSRPGGAGHYRAAAPWAFS
jgi:hypothetical protein